MAINKFLAHLVPPFPTTNLAPPVAEDWEEYVEAVDEISRAFHILRDDLAVRRTQAVAKGKELRGRGEVRRVSGDDPNAGPEDPTKSVRRQGGVRFIREGTPLPEESLLLSERDKPVRNDHLLI